MSQKTNCRQKTEVDSVESEVLYKIAKPKIESKSVAMESWVSKYLSLEKKENISWVHRSLICRSVDPRPPDGGTQRLSRRGIIR
jgi:hypothetical protein